VCTPVVPLENLREGRPQGAQLLVLLGLDGLDLGGVAEAFEQLAELGLALLRDLLPGREFLRLGRSNQLFGLRVADLQWTILQLRLAEIGSGSRAATPRSAEPVTCTSNFDERMVPARTLQERPTGTVGEAHRLDTRLPSCVGRSERRSFRPIAPAPYPCNWYTATEYLHRRGCVTRSRIVLETSESRKSAMSRAADLQGATLTDWLEEQVSTVIPRPLEASSSSAEVSDPAQLLDSGERFASLAAKDWSFTHDDTRYLTHDLHPFPAKFIPQIPATLIEALSVRGDLVYDPFGGSATTAVEAVRLGRRALSVDANPLGELIGRVKTGHISTPSRIQLDQLVAAVEGHLLDRDLPGSDTVEDLRARYASLIPPIPHIEKWFTPDAVGELALIRHLIGHITEGVAHDAAQLALSRIVIRVSNQDSETRYVAVSKTVGRSFTLRSYLESLRTVLRRLDSAALELQFGHARFLTADSRDNLADRIGDASVDLIVTSPPYPNATDYHLYHRFRLFWLGFDPRDLAAIEIGSHLRHQRNSSGFEEYCGELGQVIQGCLRVLQPGRYAVFVVGDALFKGELFSTAEATTELAAARGFEVVGMVRRDIHHTRRSFAKPARRARAEQIVVLRKPNRPVLVQLNPPAYRLWPFEVRLRAGEIQALTSAAPEARRETQLRTEQPSDSPATAPIGPFDASGRIELQLRQPFLWQVRRLTFTAEYKIGDGEWQPTWQRVLENGDSDPGRRKDPKYATHGLHPFKGKFYPQLAKAMLNISGAPVGGVILDPFCGSGTMLLEGMLNGFDARGCDFNPLAAKMSRAKTGILAVPKETVDLAIRALVDRVGVAPSEPRGSLDQFAEASLDELRSWFPERVLHKLDWILSQIRVLGNAAVVDYLEVVLSSLVRDISQQEPTDLRIRRRREPLDDAPVLELFRARLSQQHDRLLKYWSIAGRRPGLLVVPRAIQGDSRRRETYDALGLAEDSVDCVITSPPYATALPYIDTDRLSLLAVMGLDSAVRAQLERDLTGSREITRRERTRHEAALLAATATSELPEEVVDAIRAIYRANAGCEVGFRRANMASLLWRYFVDMRQHLSEVQRTMKPGAQAFYVVGDSRTNAGGEWVAIRTCENLVQIAKSVGLRHLESMSIDVTTERYQHMKNAITANQVILLEKRSEPTELPGNASTPGH
jgi:DNA modification methylase